MLADWNRDLIQNAMIAGIVLAGFTTLVLLMLAQYRRQVLAHGLLSATYDAAGTGFCMVDSDGRVARANAAYGALCGIPEQYLVRRPFIGGVPDRRAQPGTGPSALGQLARSAAAADP